MTDSVTNSAGRLRLTDEERKDFGIPSKHVTTDCGLVFMESDVERIVTQRVRDALASAVPTATRPSVVDDAGTTVVAATGNGMKSHDLYDTFIEVSGGDGNRDNGPEVHLRIRSNDGHNEGQSWFPAADVLAAIWSHSPPQHDVVDEDALRDAMALSFCRVIHWIARSVERGPDGNDVDLRACNLCRATAAEAVASVRGTGLTCRDPRAGM